ncbi:MAG: helix-turn-helix domain-containing protein [Vicinamibacterales bacterium]
MNADAEFRYGWITPQEALRHLGLGSLSALYRLLREQRLPYGRMGKRYRFRRADLDQWLTEHQPLPRAK